MAKKEAERLRSWPKKEGGAGAGGSWCEQRRGRRASLRLQLTCWDGSFPSLCFFHTVGLIASDPQGLSCPTELEEEEHEGASRRPVGRREPSHSLRRREEGDEEAEEAGRRLERAEAGAGTQQRRNAPGRGPEGRGI